MSRAGVDVGVGTYGYEEGVWAKFRGEEGPRWVRAVVLHVGYDGLSGADCAGDGVVRVSGHFLEVGSEDCFAVGGDCYPVVGLFT